MHSKDERSNCHYIVQLYVIPASWHPAYMVVVHHVVKI